MSRVAEIEAVTAAARALDTVIRGIGDDGLAARMGERNAVELLEKECRISTREARRRISIGTPLAPRLSLTGEEVEGRFPRLAAAVAAGDVPFDSPRAIPHTL